MKTISTFLLIILLSVNATAGDGRFEKAMTEALDQLYNSAGPADAEKAAALFERIAQAEKERWEPAYYAALSYLWLTGMKQGGGDMDALLDEAQRFHDLAAERAEINAELLVIQGYIHMMRLTVDPAGRGAEYGARSTQAFQKALAMDPDNPRALLMLASMKMGQAQYFKEDTSEACKMLRQADAALDNEQPANKLSPAWGKELSAMFLQSCGG